MHAEEALLVSDGALDEFNTWELFCGCYACWTIKKSMEKWPMHRRESEFVLPWCKIFRNPRSPISKLARSSRYPCAITNEKTATGRNCRVCANVPKIKQKWKVINLNQREDKALRLALSLWQAGLTNTELLLRFLWGPAQKIQAYCHIIPSVHFAACRSIVNLVCTPRELFVALCDDVWTVCATNFVAAVFPHRVDKYSIVARINKS